MAQDKFPIDLNDPKNLNPNLSDMQRNGLLGTNDNIPTTPPQPAHSLKRPEPNMPTAQELAERRKIRLASFNAWNNKPEAKRDGVKVIDTNNTKDVKKGKYYTLWVFAIIGFLVIAGSAAVISYSIYTTGGVRSMTQQVCAPIMNANLTAGDCENTCTPTMIDNSTHDCTPYIKVIVLQNGTTLITEDNETFSAN